MIGKKYWILLCAAAMLANTIKHNYKQKNDRTVKAIIGYQIKDNSTDNSEKLSLINGHAWTLLMKVRGLAKVWGSLIAGLQRTTTSGFQTLLN